VVAGNSYDVAIVGYGPVGAGAAILLADAGLRVVVLERSTAVLDLPRAVGLDGEVVRAFQRIGLGDEVAAILQPCRNPDSVAFTDSRRKPLFGVDQGPIGVNGWKDLSFFDQPELEALLRKIAARSGNIEVNLGQQVTALAQDGNEVRLQVRERESGAEREVRAEYVLGCDGAGSFVREALGIEWESLGYDQDWLVLDIEILPHAELPILTMQVCDPARLATYVCCKDPYRRWEFRLLPGEDPREMETPERVMELLDDWLPRDQYTLRRAAVYQFHAATASSWRKGRVFLAGDAAHQTPPFLGQGLNAGFRDVINLAWKLPLVRSGEATSGLLDTYQSERDPHARDLVEWAVAVGRLMEHLADTEAGKAPPAPPDAKRSGYGQGRTIPPLRAGALVEEQIRDDRFAGHLFSQPTVRTGDGGSQRLDELLGAGFSVVGRNDDALELSATSRALLERLGARVVSLEGVELEEGAFDHLFDVHAAAVVRPDRYVFGASGNGLSLDEVVGRLPERLFLAVRG
jgi:3-(3-hydroxy-phenyl)propionate hydroxylase